ncbi:arginine--tRNA ligase [Allofustis seminis]|uniref:arginine--tRNA ligase n=1 Tax=Allofustis seminis TaxID=166939 RepID=UPI000378402B|nr:arginine--tRNA ligase [Allofustis seminis]
MNQREFIAESILPHLDGALDRETLINLIEIPTNSEFGDFAFPVFVLAKHFKKSPNIIAEELVKELDHTKFDEITAVGPYLNFKIDRAKFSDAVIHKVLEEGSDYGNVDLGKGGNVPIDMSSPNIAKPMSLGHLRSTVIGESIARIQEKINYNPIRINHLGDWGTQFGKLIVAYREWGDPELVAENPIKELVELYVEFHIKAELDPSLEIKAREVFRQLEDHEPEVERLWNWFKDESIKEFERVYDLLDIKFDYHTGESFYNDKMDEVVDELAEKGISEVDDGAIIVNLDDEDLPPALIKKSDGASLYLTRDLATAYYRKRTFDFTKSLYVVGNEQSNHFKQLKAVLKKLGRDWSDDMIHIPFGLITFEGKKLSTRHGNTVLLEDVLQESINLAHDLIEEKNPNLENKDEVARKVGVGAVVYHDLKNDRMNSFDFKLEDIVQFEGDTGPYVQYTYSRARSLIEKYGKEINREHMLSLTDDYSWQVIKAIQDYERNIIRAANEYEPSIIAKYVMELARTFNKYYGNVKILEDNDELEARIALVEATSIVLKDALRLLAIETAENM